MDFISAAQIIIPELSRLAVTVCEEGDLKVPGEFEKRFCFMPGRQPLYTVSGLLEFFSKKGSDKIYLSVDTLGTHCVFIEVESSWIILGPFVASAWRNGEARKRLSEAGARDDAFLPYKNYYCSLPIIGDEYAVRTAAMLLVQTVGNPPREMEYLDSEIRKPEDMPIRISESYEELSVVEHRYELEEQLMDAVRQGRTAQALKIYSDIYYWSKGLRFMSDRLGDQIAGASTIRTLVRHAALQAGLMPVLVDTLSQEYAQKMHAAAASSRYGISPVM